MDTVSVTHCCWGSFPVEPGEPTDASLVALSGEGESEGQVCGTNARIPIVVLDYLLQFPPLNAGGKEVWSPSCDEVMMCLSRADVGLNLASSAFSCVTLGAWYNLSVPLHKAWLSKLLVKSQTVNVLIQYLCYSDSTLLL